MDEDFLKKVLDDLQLPICIEVSDVILVLRTMMGGVRLPTMEVWRSPICVSRSKACEHEGRILTK